jgi:hypothetical protein
MFGEWESISARLVTKSSSGILKMPSNTNKNSVRLLKRLYQKKGVTTCELRFAGCLNNWALGFAHRHKRIWYKSRPELLSDYNQTILACVKCHEAIEYDKELTQRVFRRLRGEEEVD